MARSFSLMTPFVFFFFFFLSVHDASDHHTAVAATRARAPSSGFESKYTSYWLYNQDKFKAGETATVVIRVPENKTNVLFQPTLSVNGKTGNSSYITGVSMKFSFHNSTGTISFIPIKTGFFNIFIEDKNYNVSDSSLNFEAIAGLIYPSVCVVSWMDFNNEFEAGTNASISIIPKDAFGNNVLFSGTDMEQEGFSLSLLNENGTIDSYINLVPYVRWFAPGYVSIEFALVTSGKFLLGAEKEGQKLNGGTLLPLEVTSGPLDVFRCTNIWKSELSTWNTWHIFSKMEILIHQRDRFGNLVSGVYDQFDAHVVKETGLTIPISDLKFKYVEPGVQLLSFTLNEQGNFTLTLSDMKNNKSISGMPYAYTVYVGYCDGTRSIVNGSGINGSFAGEPSVFSIYLNDANDNPSSVQVDRLRVRITNEVDSSSILPTIRPRELNGTGLYHQVATPLLDDKHGGKGSRSLETQASTFDVTYHTNMSGIYQIFISSGNIVLNGGQPFITEVFARISSLSMP